MTIQPNILIWTILCFCAFMLILWRLLLKPLLGFMDARDARIARARSLDRSGEKAAKALREQAAAEQNALALEYQRELKERREALEAEASALVPELATSLKAQIDAFTDKLTAYGER